MPSEVSSLLVTGWIDSSKILGTAEIARFIRISISAGHSAGLRRVQHKTSCLHRKWRENLIPQKVPEYPLFYNDFYVFLDDFGSVSLVRGQTSILRYE